MEDSEGPGQGSAEGKEEQSRQPPSSAWSSEFYLFSFKIVPCTASYAHNWSLCPFVHPNEKARRRDPRVYSYEPLPCPFDKKGANCPHGDHCTYTHNVYEYWLHPKRFRTQMCQQGASCKRTLCFFAHNLQELRFADGQLQRGMPSPQGPTAGLAAGAAQPGLMPAGARPQQQQQAAVAAAGGMGAGQYVPYAVMPTGPGAASLPPLQPGFIPSPVAAGAPNLAQARAMAAQAAQQQGWMPGYITPQGYVMLSGAQGQLYPGSAYMQPQGADPTAGQFQQQQYLPTTRSQFQSEYNSAGDATGMQLPMGSAGMGAAGVCRPMTGGAGRFPSLHLDPALMGSQFQVVPADDQVLLGQGPRMTADSSSSYHLVAQQQQVQQEAAAAAAAVSGSQYSWSMNPGAGPSTTSASVSMSLLSMPNVGLSSSASVPGSSNNSHSHVRPGQTGAVSLDVLQATMQHMSIRDCHVRDL